jgi:dienelactone hydrolase
MIRRSVSLVVLVMLGVLSPLPVRSQAEGTLWEPAAGTWSSGAADGAGQAGGSEWALLLSHEWYGDFVFAGTVAGNGGANLAIMARYAGESESYTVVVDWQRERLRLRENHFGESQDALSTGLGGLRREYPVHFRIEAKGDRLTAALWPEGGKAEGAARLEFSDLKIPGGRVGVGVKGGGLKYSGLHLEGSTDISYSPYAFHCNYQLGASGVNKPLWEYLDAEGMDAQRRQRRSFRSVEEFEAYRKATVLRLRRSLGLDPWPDRNPLNARLVGTVQRRGFRVEKIIYESQPGFLVDALLYIPDGLKQPAPGIVSTIGHYDDEGFFEWLEQGRCIGLAKKGYVVLTYDPISQGERKWLGHGNHDELRKKIILSGMETSGLMFWDSMRAIDYLVSRPEVDASRIGVTGVSGGGFNALYTAVLDERVKAVAPNGFATSIEALIKRVGAGCCAYLPNMTRYTEMPEIFSLIAPRKLLILGGYMDILSDRVLEDYEAARKVYRLYGAEQNVQYYLDRDGGHTYSKPMRLALYRWFNLWLQGVSDPAAAREVMDPEDMLVSRESGTYKVFAPGEKGRDVIELERDYLARNRVRYPEPSSATELKQQQAAIRTRLVELMGEMAPAHTPSVVRDDHEILPGTVRSAVLKTERDLPVAVRVHHPPAEIAHKGLLVYLAMEPRYSSADLDAAEAVDRLVKQGYVVAVPEVRGTGATQVAGMPSVALFAMALGKHLFSTRIYDLQRVIDYLEAQPEYRGLSLTVWGEGAREGLMTLYLAAIDGRVDTAVSSHGLVTYQNIVDEDGLPDFDYYVPGVLKYADVPQMLGAIAPRRAIVIAPVDIRNQRVGVDEARHAYAWAEKAYETLGNAPRFSVAADTGTRVP